MKTSDVDAGMLLAPVELMTVWARVQFLGTFEESAENKISRFDKYEVECRLQPIYKTKKQINTLRFTVDGQFTIYPKEAKVQGINVVFQAYRRYDQPYLET